MTTMASAVKGRSTAGFLGESGSKTKGSQWLGPNSMHEISKKFPVASKQLKEDILLQCTADSKWIERRVIIMPSSIVITHVKNDRVIEEISFADVVEVSHVQPELAFFHYSRTASRGLLSREVDNYLHPHGACTREHVFGINVQHTFFKDAHCIVLQADSTAAVDEWRVALKEAKRAWEAQRSWSPECLHLIRARASAVYNSNVTQGFIAVLIFANFVGSAIQAQYVPDEGTSEEAMYDQLDLAFTVAFTVELVANIFVNWFMPFISDGWNVFDLFVVTTSLISLVLEDLPGVSILRIVRAFRVLRLFGRLGSLRRIINALTCSWLPVLNAFAVVMFITAVYAILGVTFFRTSSLRHFGSFSSAFVTMFTVTTMEGWVDLMDSELADEDGNKTAGAVLFFISFILIVVWTMLPVVVAILLDNFTMAATKEETKADEARMITTKAEMCRALDPLMSILAMFTSEDELRIRISELFQLLNSDELASVTYEDLRHGFSKLHIPDVLIDFTYEEYERLTKRGAICDADGRVGPRAFERMMVRELRDFTERGIASAMALEMVNGSPGMVAALCSLKMQALEFDDDFEEIETMAAEKQRRQSMVTEQAGMASPARRRTSFSLFLSGGSNPPVPASPNRSQTSSTQRRQRQERPSNSWGLPALNARSLSSPEGSRCSPQESTRHLQARIPKQLLGDDSDGKEEEGKEESKEESKEGSNGVVRSPRMIARTGSSNRRGLFGVRKASVRSGKAMRREEEEEEGNLKLGSLGLGLGGGGPEPRHRADGRLQLNGGAAAGAGGIGNGDGGHGGGGEEVMQALAAMQRQQEEILSAIAQLQLAQSSHLCAGCRAAAPPHCSKCGVSVEERARPGGGAQFSGPGTGSHGPGVSREPRAAASLPVPVRASLAPGMQAVSISLPSAEIVYAAAGDFNATGSFRGVARESPAAEAAEEEGPRPAVPPLPPRRLRALSQDQHAPAPGHVSLRGWVE